MMVMQDAEQKRPTMRRLGDQIGAWFTPVALLLALAAWYFTGDSLRFLAVLVVALGGRGAGARPGANSQ